MTIQTYTEKIKTQSTPKKFRKCSEGNEIEEQIFWEKIEIPKPRSHLFFFSMGKHEFK